MLNEIYNHIHWPYLNIDVTIVHFSVMISTHLLPGEQNTKENIMLTSNVGRHAIARLQ